MFQHRYFLNKQIRDSALLYNIEIFIDNFHRHADI